MDYPSYKLRPISWITLPTNLDQSKYPSHKLRQTNLSWITYPSYKLRPIRIPFLQTQTNLSWITLPTNLDHSESQVTLILGKQTSPGEHQQIQTFWTHVSELLYGGQAFLPVGVHQTAEDIGRQGFRSFLIHHLILLQECHCVLTGWRQEVRSSFLPLCSGRGWQTISHILVLKKLQMRLCKYYPVLVTKDFLEWYWRQLKIQLFLFGFSFWTTGTHTDIQRLTNKRGLDISLKTQKLPARLNILPDPRQELLTKCELISIRHNTLGKPRWVWSHQLILTVKMGLISSLSTQDLQPRWGWSHQFQHKTYSQDGADLISFNTRLTAKMGLISSVSTQDLQPRWVQRVGQPCLPCLLPFLFPWPPSCCSLHWPASWLLAGDSNMGWLPKRKI